MELVYLWSYKVKFYWTPFAVILESDQDSQKCCSYKSDDNFNPKQSVWYCYFSQCRKSADYERNVKMCGHTIRCVVTLSFSTWTWKVTSSPARILMPKSGRIRAPRTRRRRPRMTIFCTEVALNERVEAPPLVME